MTDQPLLGTPQVKICGLTTVDEAMACADAGAAAIGFISYPKSPRHLEDHAIRDITLALPDTICKVGVFVNERYERLLRAADIGGLQAVQLHGQEDPDLVDSRVDHGLVVIKVLFVNGNPGLDMASHYNPSAFLVECAGGPLPGGNAMVWNWAEARSLGGDLPVVLAGGLTPENVGQAIDTGRPDAVDVSSGVEIQPGNKDLAKVTAFCQTVAASRERPCRKVF